MNVLSLFDGMSCGQIALDQLGIKVDTYYASEIDKWAVKVAKENYPNTIHVGDVTKLKGEFFSHKKIDLLIGGSPCQGFSFAGKQLNFDDPRSALFFEYVRLLKELKPKYFLLENVRMKKEFQDVITEYLGVEPIMINSSLVSAQNRVRLYWTNIPNVTQPEDRGIILGDILEESTDPKFDLSDKAIDYMKRHRNGKPRFEYHKNPIEGKASCIVAVQYKGVPYGVLEKPCTLREVEVETIEGRLNSECHHVATADDINGHDCIKRVYAESGKAPTLNACTGGNREPKILCGRIVGRCLDENGVRQDHKGSVKGKTEQMLEVRADEKTNCLSTVQKDNIVVTPPKYRKLTPLECERLQTVPDNYTGSVSNSQRYKMLGNGWTVEVIKHIFKEMQND